MGRTIGIDLGTTYSAVGIIGSAGKPEIVPNREGDRITPSVVLFQGDETLVGTMAKRTAPTAPTAVVQFVKRQMGNHDWLFTTSECVSYSPEQVSAIILRRLKEDTEAVLGEDISDVVITVPAYFNDARRKATMDAGKIAGLNVRRIINEPTAAALAFGVSPDADGTVLVYDLGGGTFDVTVMRISQGSFEVVATDGNRNLGGYDWDGALMEHINDQIQAQGGPDLMDDALQAADLGDKAEAAKRALTTMTTTKVFISAGGKAYNVPVTRAEFEDMTSGLLSETRDLTGSVLEAAALTWGQIDKVLLVGGSTHMPMVHDAIVQMSGKEPVRGVNPDEAVALGAAIQAAVVDTPAGGLGPGRGGTKALPGGVPVIHDVSAHGLGTLALNSDHGNKLWNFVIIPHNTRIPAKSGDDFVTLEDNQRVIEVVITQGDETDPDRVDHVGTSRYDLPPYPAGSPIRIEISYDIDGMIHAEIFDGVTKKKLGDMHIEREANLTEEEIQAATAQMRKLEVN
jgi:molecular chaperone DnaK